MRMQGLARIAAAALIAGGLMFATLGQVESAPSPDPATVPARLGVVDFTKLMQVHPDYSRLNELDGLISSLESRIESRPQGPSPKVQKEIMARIKAEQDRLKKQLETEYNQAKAELEGQSAAMAQELNAMAAESQAIMDNLVKELKGKLPSQPAAPPPQAADLDARMKRFYQDLLLVRDRQVAARQLELQRQVELRLSQEKAALNSELAAYESQLLRESQERKVNLELKKMSVTTDEEKAAIDTEIAGLKEQEAAKRDARARELDARYATVRDQELGRIRREVEAYRSRLDADARNQMNAEIRRVGGGYVPQQPAVTAQTVKSLQAVVQQRQAQLKAQFEARKAQLEGELAANQAAMQKKMEKRQKQLEAQFKKIADKIMADADKSTRQLDKNDEKILAKLREERDALKAQRESLQKAMEADLREKVDKHITTGQVVLGSYMVNVDCVDLTPQALEWVRQ